MKTLDQIRAGLDKDEFFLEFMPTMSLAEERCVGAEALIRWRHHDEFVSPLEFIPLAENTPLSGLLTFRVIELIGRDLGEWLRASDGVHIGINVSPDLIGRGALEYAVQNAGIFDLTDKLLLEVTERGYPDKQALAALLSAKGRTKIALDDFGTGDANLLQLSQMHADVLKLDKFFVDQIVDTDNIPNIVKGLTAFALAMEYELIAEGVESAVQVEVLRELGVQMSQGWYFSKSLPVNEFLEFYKSRQ